jgi:hypothetical protein
MTTRSMARGFFKGAHVEAVTAHTPTGDKPVFLLTIEESDAAGSIQSHSFFMPPQDFQSLCATLQEALSANG